METLKAEGLGTEGLQKLRDHRLLHPEKHSTTTDGENKTLDDKPNLINIYL